jgi:hypothetical protein
VPSLSAIGDAWQKEKLKTAHPYKWLIIGHKIVRKTPFSVLEVRAVSAHAQAETGGRLGSSDAHPDGHISRAYVIESLSSRK